MQSANRIEPVHYRTAVVGGVDVFYREAGPDSGPVTDQPEAEYHALQTGHFALEDKAAEIAALMRDFLARTVPHRPAATAAGRNGAENG